VIAAEPGLWLWAHFDRTPNALFGRWVRARCTLALALHGFGVELLNHGQWDQAGVCLRQALQFDGCCLEVRVLR